MLKVHICSNPKITSKYGPRFHPVKKSWGFHNGVDIISKSGGTSLFAIADGVIFDNGCDELNGNFIKVKYIINGDESAVELSAKGYENVFGGKKCK